MAAMEVHEVLRRATEESLTIEDCSFFLSKTGEKPAQTLFKNYLRKYYPKNSSLSQYYDHCAKKVSNEIKYESKLFGKKKKATSSAERLPAMGRKTDRRMGEWEKIIEMTTLEGVVTKGCIFPRMKIR